MIWEGGGKGTYDVSWLVVEQSVEVPIQLYQVEL